MKPAPSVFRKENPAGHSGPRCRLCGGADLSMVFSMGRTPLANALLTREQLEQPEPTYPLDLAFCPGCALVQITETVPPEKLFREYLYFSSFSDTRLRQARELVEQALKSRSLNKESLVVEVASNDGYLLQYFKQAGIPVLGIEPAVNVARVAEERGIPTLCDFFGVDLARQMRSQNQGADVLIANNVLAHVADLNGFVEGIQILLKETGVAIIEVPYVREMIARCEFDTIYHEHLCYYSVTALDRLFKKHRLLLQDAQLVEIHGGSLRLFVVPAAGGAAPHESVRQLLESESALGMDRPEFYSRFSSRVGQLRESIRRLTADLKKAGKRIAAYGASAKGSVFTNYIGLGKETLDFVVDRSNYKQGLFMPGTHLPILPPEKLLEAMPDYCLVLTWNIAPEIIQQQNAYRQKGGKLIIPIPEPTIV